MVRAKCIYVLKNEVEHIDLSLNVTVIHIMPIVAEIVSFVVVHLLKICQFALNRKLDGTYSIMGIEFVFQAFRSFLLYNISLLGRFRWHYDTNLPHNFIIQVNCNCDHKVQILQKDHFVEIFIHLPSIVELFTVKYNQSFEVLIP